MLRSLLLALACLVASHAAAETRYYIPDVPADLKAVDFYLITAGVGPHLHERFGHTGIRVRDHVNDKDVVFNWGRFSFNEPGFALKFYRGSLTYSMAVRTFEMEIAAFAQAERRLLEEPIQLTDGQKRALLEKIAWNAAPENRPFAYQYWYKNCATIPRDYLDEVLEGQVRAKFAATAAGGAVFRDFVRRHLRTIPFVVPGLDILMNGNIDRPISEWESAFLPERLREILLQMPRIDDDGNPVPGTHLLGPTTVLVEAPETFAPALPDYLLLTLLGSAPLGIAGVAWLARRRRLAYRALGWAGIGWGALSGLIGIALLVNWLASGHPDGWHNANLLVFFPVDWLYVALGIRLVVVGDRIKDRLVFLHSGRMLAVAHLGAAVGLALLAAFGVIEQDVWRVLAWFGTTSCLLAASYGTLAFGEPVAAAAAPSRAPRRNGKLAPTRVARQR